MMNPMIAPIIATPATPPTVPPTISATWSVGEDVAVVAVVELSEEDEVDEGGDGTVVDDAKDKNKDEDEDGEEVVGVIGERAKWMIDAESEQVNQEYVPNLKVTHSGYWAEVLLVGRVSNFFRPAGPKTYQKPVPGSHPSTAHEAALWAEL